MDEDIRDSEMKETKTCLCFPEFLLNFSIGNPAKILTPLWKRHQDIAIPIVAQFFENQVHCPLVLNEMKGGLVKQTKPNLKKI